jgi:hypothetical protein
MTFLETTKPSIEIATHRVALYASLKKEETSVKKILLFTSGKTLSASKQNPDQLSGHPVLSASVHMQCWRYFN